MNKYGSLAQDYWTQHRPAATAQISDPQAFFSTLGEQISDRVVQLLDPLAGPDLAGEGYLEKVGRLNMTRMQAEEIALDEMVYSNPVEEDPEQDEGPSEIGLFLHEVWRAGQDDLDQ